MGVDVADFLDAPEVVPGSFKLLASGLKNMEKKLIYLTLLFIISNACQIITFFYEINGFWIEMYFLTKTPNPNLV